MRDKAHNSKKSQVLKAFVYKLVKNLTHPPTLAQLEHFELPQLEHLQGEQLTLGWGIWEGTLLEPNSQPNAQETDIY